ncbi:Uncharacterised protein [Prevotella pallens]|uniref:Uncharacterized protein n=1 Tax=Prevotella pallens TaxID=60133 RepID=A0A379G9P4_9BACT|nr:Uncharacterised protein [Prevotella pallens]
MFRKWSTSFCVYNILITTHLQPEYTTNTHETRSEHSARRRGRFIAPVSSYYQICVPLPHFVGVHVYAGTINRTPTAANGLQQRCERFTNNVTPTHETQQNTPPSVGTDSSRPYPDITKYTFSFHHTRVSTLLNMCFRPPFCGCLCICKHHKIVHQRTLATRYGTTTYTKCLLLQCKNHTFATQKPPFWLMPILLL